MYENIHLDIRLMFYFLVSTKTHRYYLLVLSLQIVLLNHLEIFYPLFCFVLELIGIFDDAVPFHSDGVF
jgi:hypothetical protein